ncbi:MAG TPA: hypothetical protein ENG62_02330 [Thermoplasmatales archaeon]|nr:hypothetical protein [Thermoplasmatales archaeon]
MKEIKVFTPAHITCFFEPCIYDSYTESGSKGAGINLSKGVYTNIRIIEDSQQIIETCINGRRIDSSLIKDCVKQLIRDEKLHVFVENQLELPVSQGFGMSAASLLGTSMGIAKLLDIDELEATRIAHTVEIKHHTGLGDITGILAGGVEIRIKPGIPGETRNIPFDGEIIVCILPEVLETRKVLTDSGKMRLIKEYGSRCLQELLLEPSIEKLFNLSWRFTLQTKLVTPRIQEIVVEATKHGLASMCMLGNSIYAIGDIDRLEEKLRFFGETIRCKVDWNGIRFYR